MISDAAVIHGIGRGFDGADPVEDRLMAEEAVAFMLYGKEKHYSQSGL
ncbi:MAG: hypothetical protein WA435_12425 [Gallionellaceae bacterium]